MAADPSMQELFLRNRETFFARQKLEQSEQYYKNKQLPRVLSWLHATDYSGENSPLAQSLETHVQGTGSWLASLPTFEIWKSSTTPDSGLLWLSGV